MMRRVRALSRLTALSARPGARPLVSASRVSLTPSTSATPIALPHRGIVPGVRAFAASSKASTEGVGPDGRRTKIDMSQFPPERIRNLSIIAHIDHGKSTLADRLLQMTNTLPPESSPQFLDKLKVERERGITVKAQTVSIIHTHTDGKKYLINLIDTPGHVDFSYEVSRSLGACEGGLLLVDCTQGIQAQTLSVFHHALEANLTLLPVINKVDLPHAEADQTSEQIASSLGLPKEDHMRISAKSGLGVEHVLNQIIDGLPPPRWDDSDKRLRALVFDTFYDRFRGVVSLVRVMSGSIKKGDKVKFLQTGKKYDVLDVGINNPDEVPVDALREGQVGYLVCNMKNSEEAHIGDTIAYVDKSVDALPGFKPMKAMVYAGVFPTDSAEFTVLEEAINRLTLNDRSVSVERESSAALGQGFRLGFLGTLHMDVFRQRLEDEYDSEVIVTAPTVPYKLVYRDGKEEYISNPAEFPDVTDTRFKVERVEEPMVNATIFVPNDYIGDMMDLCSKYRGVQLEYKFLEGTDRAILRYSLPLSEIVTDFFSDLKSASSGFASFDYEEAGYEASNLVKLNILLNAKPVDALAMIVHRPAAPAIGRVWTKKLKEVLPRQLFELSIQAAVGNKVVSRETLSAMRKDVTAGLYGGHYERKMKHLNKQKEGKKRLKKLAGNIDIPQSAFFQVLSARPRSFTTSARFHVQAHHDWLTTELPPSPPPLPKRRAAAGSNRYSLPHISPQQRSSMLSDIHVQITEQAPGSSENLFNDFSRLYLSSTSHSFTPVELKAIAKAMHVMDRRHLYHVRDANDRLKTVAGALKDTVRREYTAVHGLEAALFVSAARHRRSFTNKDLRQAERHFEHRFPKVPDDDVRLHEYKVSINHMLYLCLVAKDIPRYDKFWHRMIASGIEPGSWANLTRILAAGMGPSPRSVVDELAKALRVTEDPDNAVILVNAAIWLRVKAGDMETAYKLYNGLRSRPSRFHQPPPDDDAISSIDFARLRPSRYTYPMMVNGLGWRGDLVAALKVLREMIDDGHVPRIHDYTGLFRGFAKYGEVPSGPAGGATSAFPLWLNFGSPSQLTSVWSTRRSEFLPSFGGWTLDALEDVFHSFLSARLPANASRSQQPTEKLIYYILVAFARTTNADETTVRATLDALTKKFGPNNPEGWEGWNESSRIMKIREVLAKQGASRRPQGGP
ncbi:Translation factor GUF1, mitochondrial [Vanrija pseudolonga]|uniref:Translation factor GUF1, mitochondrial n=1 Tax=Vanrija pseudolonga TaxID=143232 RepID=A0AAF0Y917_9TREE|nr:Translation factor GUF1, mitochondrial [Vanrija pseudolonga]